jgi:hypothetical protein
MQFVLFRRMVVKGHGRFAVFGRRNVRTLVVQDDRVGACCGSGRAAGGPVLALWVDAHDPSDWIAAETAIFKIFSAVSRLIFMTVSFDSFDLFRPGARLCVTPRRFRPIEITWGWRLRIFLYVSSPKLYDKSIFTRCENTRSSKVASICTVAASTIMCGREPSPDLRLLSFIQREKKKGKGCE